MVFLASKSILPEANVGNLWAAFKPTNSTLLESPNIPAAIALQKSTSKPLQFPASSWAEKPGKPALTPHIK